MSFTKTFHEEQLAIDYLNKLINNDLSIITLEDVITKVEFDRFKRYIVVFTRGLESNEDLYFTERVESKEVSETQYNNFISSCFVQWKLVFGKYNTDYRNGLYKRKLLGFQNVH